MRNIIFFHRIKQESSKTSLNGAGTDKVHSSLEMDIDEKNSDLKPTCNIKESDQQKVNTVKSSAPPRERISARIRDLKSKKVAYKEEWVDPDQIRLSGQKIPVQSNKNSSSHEEITKTVTRKRKRKVQQNFQSMEDYVNESPLIQVGNLVGLRQCRLCAVMFVEKEQLMNHMKAVHHLGERKYCWSYCFLVLPKGMLSKLHNVLSLCFFFIVSVNTNAVL